MDQDRKIEIQKLFSYAGEATCATDGLCALACPVGIDTPSIINKLRIMHPQKFDNTYMELSYDFLDSHVKWLKETVKIELLLLISNILSKQKEH